METIVFASNNRHKVDEIKAIVGATWQVISLKEAGIDIEIPEPHHTLEENAAEKSRTIYALTGKSCFSDDSGLEVDALNGEPGVKSARYAGPENNFQKNVEKLLKNLEDVENRTARFGTVISLIIKGEEFLFEGVCQGSITRAPRGLEGFGYDPIFVPEGSEKTFAEMTMTEKNSFSHRQKAVLKLVRFLSQFRTNPSP